MNCIKRRRRTFVEGLAINLNICFFLLETKDMNIQRKPSGKVSIQTVTNGDTTILGECMSGLSSKTIPGECMSGVGSNTIPGECMSGLSSKTIPGECMSGLSSNTINCSPCFLEQETLLS